MAKEQETDMNKYIAAALIAGGLLLLDSPEAAAHNEVRIAYQPSHHHLDLRRSQQMPGWLKRDKAFRHWYRHTRLRKHRHLTWHRLFDIYRWEANDRRAHRRADRVTRNHDYYRYHDCDQRRRLGH
jgi:hypothetical protein